MAPPPSISLDVESPAQTTTPWPDAAGHVIHLAEAAGPTERSMLEQWLRASRPPNESARHDIVYVDTSRSRVVSPAGWVLDPSSEATVVPLRATWARPGRGAPRLRDLLLGDPQRPNRLVSRYLAWRHPDRLRLLAGPPATAIELDERYRSTHVDASDQILEDLTSFAVRAAGITLDVHERRLDGRRYKVPRAVIDSCRHSPSFRRAIHDLASREGRDETEVLREAHNDLEEMAATPTPFFIDWTGMLTRWIISLGYREVVVDPDAVEKVRRHVRDHPSAFLFTHKSHIDGMALIWVLYDNDITAPHQLGGINMAFRGLATLSRKGGTIFIRRSFGDDQVYKTTLQQYLSYLMEKRFPFSWAFEGTRSRTGKLMPPRYGILKYVTESAQAAGTDDLHFVPVAISYDLIGEVDDYSRQEAGLPKQDESFSWFVGYLRKLRAPMGRLYVDFGDPVVFDGSAAQEEPNLPDVAFEVARRVNTLVPVTLPALLCTVLIGRAPQAMTLSQLDIELREIIDWLRERGVRLAGSFDETDAEQLEQLANIVFDRGLIERYNLGPTAVFSIRDDQYPMAGYYRNTIVHYFVDKAIAEIALLSAIDAADAERADVFWTEARNLRDLLKFEFFHSDGDTFVTNLEAELSRADESWSATLNGQADGVRSLLEGMRPIVAPATLRSFIEGYWIVAELFAELEPSETLAEDAAVELALPWGEQLCRQRLVSTRASVGKQLFRGAHQLLGHRGLLEPGNGVDEERRALAADLRRLADATAGLTRVATGENQERAR